MDYRELVHLGLSEKEAKVYLAALELGKSPVQKIAQKASVNRATTYVQIQSLTKKGLVSSYAEGKKQYFIAEAPEKLSLLFREQSMAIQRKQEYLDKILPGLKSISNLTKDKPTVRYFEGKDGLRAMSEEFFLIKHVESAKMIYSVDLLNKVFTEEERMLMLERRMGKKVKVKSIINDEENRLVSDAENYTIPCSKYPITSDIAFFGDKVRIATQKGELVGLIIENKEISDTLKTLFDLAWQYIKTHYKKSKGSKK